MLPEQAIELLTAFVDGELSQRQHKAVMRLLQKSSEARALLKELQENAHDLKQLPRHKLEPSLVDEILQAIAEQKARPAPQPARSRGTWRRWLPYVAASMAASLLIAAIGLLYWKNMIEPDGGHKKADFVKTGPEKKIEPKERTPDPEPIPIPNVKPKSKVPDSRPFDMATEIARNFGAPIKPEVIFSARFPEFAKPAVADKFASEINRKKRTIQLDVTVKNNAIAMERLKAALNERGLLVVSDPSATKDLKANAKREYWVYAENLSNDELTKVMQDLAKADTSGQGKSVPSPYDSVKLTAITKNETTKMASLLGVKADPIAVPKDVKKPTMPPKRWERMAVVLPTVSPKMQSDAIEQFLKGRQRPTPGAVQVLIKIRQQ